MKLKCYEYEWLFDESTGKLTCKRNGIDWRDETGDGAILALLQVACDARAKALQEAADRAEKWFDSVTYGDDYGDTALFTGVESDQLRDAILGVDKP